MKDKYDKQIDILNGRAVNPDIENSALIIFNIYKAMHNKTYLCDSWNDCSNHIKSISHDAVKAEILFVEREGGRYQDVNKLAKKYQYRKDPKNEVLHSII